MKYLFENKAHYGFENAQMIELEVKNTMKELILFCQFIHLFRVISVGNKWSFYKFSNSKREIFHIKIEKGERIPNFIIRFALRNRNNNNRLHEIMKLD